MKCQIALLILCPFLAWAGNASPVNKVVLFLKELQKESTEEMAAEKASYDKYAKWCEETVKVTTEDIASAKKTIDKTTTTIEKNSGTGAASGAEIKYLKKSIVENKASQKEAEAVRTEENDKFVKATTDLKNGLKQLKEMSAKLASTDEKKDEKKSSFLSMSNSLESQRAAMARLLMMPSFGSKLSMADLRSLKSFAHPDPELMQLGEEPSSNVQGVLAIIKQTMEDYQEDLKEATAEEDEKAKAHKKLMATLSTELKTLKTNLAEKEEAMGASGKTLADAKMLRAQTEEELKADSKLLEETEDACKIKNEQFTARRKLREDEIAGISKALEILNSDGAKKTFADSAKVSFLQVSSEQEDNSRKMAYKAVKRVASKFHSIALAEIALEVQTGGPFDKVLDIIDNQIKTLRTEEETDVKHRDSCQKQQSDVAKKIVELGHSVKKLATKITHLGSSKKEMGEELKKIKAGIKETKTEIKEIETMRNKEHAEFIKAVKHDKDALAIVEDAIDAITAFYKENKIKVSLEQETVDGPGNRKKKAAPETSFKDAKYGGKTDAANGVISLMKMVAEDMAAEIEEGQKADDEDQEEYEKNYAVLKEKLDKLKAEEVSQTKEIADTEEKIASKTADKGATKDEKDAATAEEKTLNSNCEWVTKNFKSRREKRQAEIEGLTEAKGLLAANAPR